MTHPVTEIDLPTVEVIQTAMITSATLARENLSDAAYEIGAGLLPDAIAFIGTAKDMLSSCLGLLEAIEDLVSGELAAKLRAGVNRAVASCNAAEAQTQLWSYQTPGDDTATKHRRFAKKAAEEAKNESHRLLAALAEAFPQASTDPLEEK